MSRLADDDYWRIAEDVCTPKQLQALELYLKHRMPYRTIALQLDISLATVRDRIARAIQLIEIRQRGTAA